MFIIDKNKIEDFEREREREREEKKLSVLENDKRQVLPT
jgi:hypothetical protein